MKIYRAVIRGHFDNLDTATEALLLQRQADHDFLKSAFTKQGTLTYDKQLVAFNVRFEIRCKDDEVHDEASVQELAVTQTTALLDAFGYPHHKLRASITDMADMWASR